ncbi:MAG: hypothetical protein K0R03_1613 [Moraxellaceae bacterium]|jgi:hypothetical protein|nr:hypothetical protein [Moraxellaceae bacterium]
MSHAVKKKNFLLLPLVLLLATAASADFVQPQGRQDCLVANPVPQPNEEVRWSGGVQGRPCRRNGCAGVVPER